METWLARGPTLEAFWRRFNGFDISVLIDSYISPSLLEVLAKETPPHVINQHMQISRPANAAQSWWKISVKENWMRYDIEELVFIWVLIDTDVIIHRLSLMRRGKSLDFTIYPPRHSWPPLNCILYWISITNVFLWSDLGGAVLLGKQ